jgi:hypothetical protein
MKNNRVENWQKFAKHMEAYIRDRTVEKYGVKNSGEAAGFDLMSITKNPLICVWNILRYSLRNWNGKQKNHDIEKIAHYAELTWTMSDTILAHLLLIFDQSIPEHLTTGKFYRVSLLFNLIQKSLLWSPCIKIIPSFTVPPEPRKRFNVLASWCSFLSSSGTPKTAVTVFPFRPLTSLLILTIPSFGYIDCFLTVFFFLQVHFVAGCPQEGQIRPDSVE